MNGLFVEVKEGIEFIYINIGTRLPKQGSKRKDTFLSQTEKGLEFPEIKRLSEEHSIRGGDRAGLKTWAVWLQILGISSVNLPPSIEKT